MGMTCYRAFIQPSASGIHIRTTTAGKNEFFAFFKDNIFNGLDFFLTIVYSKDENEKKTRI